MSEYFTNDDVIDAAGYAADTLDANAALPRLGFQKSTSNDKNSYWYKRISANVFLGVVFHLDSGLVSCSRVVRDPVTTGQRELFQAVDIPVTKVADWMAAQSKTSQTEAMELIRGLLDADPDALQPRSEIDRLISGTCPECGSDNVSPEADEEGLVDCMNCGIWWNPLAKGVYDQPVAEGIVHATRLRNDEGLDDEIGDLKGYALKHGEKPRIRISFARTTPESAADGDNSETGWIDEEGVAMEVDDEDREMELTLEYITARYLINEGALYPSSSSFHAGIWYSTEPAVIDYRTGETEERSYHLYGFSEQQERQIWNELH